MEALLLLLATTCRRFCFHFLAERAELVANLCARNVFVQQMMIRFLSPQEFARSVLSDELEEEEDEEAEEELRRETRPGKRM